MSPIEPMTCSAHPFTFDIGARGYAQVCSHGTVVGRSANGAAVHYRVRFDLLTESEVVSEPRLEPSTASVPRPGSSKRWASARAWAKATHDRSFRLEAATPLFGKAHAVEGAA